MRTCLVPTQRGSLCRTLLLFVLLAFPVYADSPEETVSKLYGWLLKADAKIGPRISEVQGLFTPQLFQQLKLAYNADPNKGEFLDFDPWSNTQMGANHYDWGKAKITGNQAKVPITVTIVGGNEKQTYTCILQHGKTWQVANLVYSPEFDLLSTLRKITGK